LNSIISEMDSAVADIEAEINELEREGAALVESVKQTVGAMSDLRYGRFANSQLHDGVLEGLKDFQEACDSKS
jgi:centromere-localized protein 2